MRQKCVKMGLVLLGKEERRKCVRNPSKLRQKCVKVPRNTFGGEHLLDDTDKLGWILNSETGRIRFRRVRFQTPSSVSFFIFSGLIEFSGANSVSSSQPIICVQTRTHRVCLNSPSLPQNSVRLSEISSPKQYSRNSIPPISHKWGRFPNLPEMSRFAPVCPLLSRFVPILGPKH